MGRSRGHFDPELTAESRMRRMREEMYTLRETIISLVPVPFKAIIEPRYDLTREESRNWLNSTANKIIEITEPDQYGKAICPLCGSVPQFVGVGYSYPIGLERHLTGSHNVQKCPVMHAADGLRRVRHREQYPDDYGPYGCD